MNKYIVINSEDIQKRIEEYKKDITFLLFNNEHELATNYNIRIEVLNSVLSNSKPLEEELGKAYREGYCYSQYHEYNEELDRPIKSEQDYINQLKLDI